MTEPLLDPDNSTVTITTGTYGDRVTGTQAADSLQGGYGRDVLEGGEGDDTLDGGFGDDTLVGGAGRDTFLLGRDSGFVHTANYGSSTPIGDLPDRILLRPGIALNDVGITRAGTSHVIVSILDTDARISVNWSATVSPDAVFLETADGQTLTYGQIGAWPVDYHYTANPQPIEAQAPGTTLSGTAQSEYLDSTYRDTTFAPGGGTDYISGGPDSTILFDRDSGQDLVYASSLPAQAGDVLKIRLGQTVTTDDILIIRGRYDMPGIRIAGTPAELRLGNSAYFQNTPGAPAVQLVFDDGTVWGNADLAARVQQSPHVKLNLFGEAGNDALHGSDFDDTLEGWFGDDTLTGGRGLDTLNGGEGQDLLQGGDQADDLHGDEGDDTLDGGAGSDLLEGGAGQDVYLFGRGSWHDRITNRDGQDVLRLGAGLGPEDVRLSCTSPNGELTLSIVGADDRISFAAPVGQPYESQAKPWAVSRIEFADGTVWREADMAALLRQATEGDDTVLGAETPDLLRGLGGNDKLYGGHGDDTLEGSTGDDTLDGSFGNDTFVFHRGDGADRIVDASYSVPVDPEFDVLTLPDFLVEDVEGVYLRNELDVTIQFKTGDRVTLANQKTFYYTDWYVTAYTSGVSEVRFADGSAWDRDAILARAQPTYLVGTPQADTLDGTGKIEWLTGGFGNDVYIVDGRTDAASSDVIPDEVVEYSGTTGGIDQVVTELSTYRLPESVENLVMAGKGQSTPGAAGTPGSMPGKAGMRHGIGNNLGNVIEGSLGKDLLEGLEGDDMLTGLFGNDTLDGGQGNDTLAGGLGNDLLRDGSATSDDTYQWGRGEGADRMEDGGGANTLKVAAGTSREQLWLRQTGEDLEISVIGTSDRFTVANWYGGAGDTPRLARIALSDGQVLLGTKVQQLVDSMAAFTPPPPGQTVLPTDTSTTLLAAIATSWT